MKHLDFYDRLSAGVYFELLDSQGHSYGPLSRQVMDVMKNLDQVMSYLVQTLNTSSFSDVNLLVFSDHGQTRVTPQRVINLVDVIETGDYEAIMGDISVVGIYPKENRESKVVCSPVPPHLFSRLITKLIAYNLTTLLCSFKRQPKRVSNIISRYSSVVLAISVDQHLIAN